MSGLQSCLAPLRTELGRCSDACAALTQQLTCANAKLSALRAAKEALDAEAQDARQEKACLDRKLAAAAVAQLGADMHLAAKQLRCVQAAQQVEDATAVIDAKTRQLQRAEAQLHGSQGNE